MGILVVDDNQANLFVIQHILKRAGYKDHLTFSSAKDMFQYLQGYSPFSADIKADIILMDIMMPEMDGIEACRQLQQDPLLKDIPVIFVTALEDSNKVAEALDAGGTDYVMKPINKTELLARIRAALRLKYEKDWHKEQDNKIKNELDLSMQVQTSMLSEPIYHEHTLLKASYLPANKLAGDMYYWHQIDEHRYAAIQLDMMGHGISASLVCMFISSVLRDAIRTCSDPEYVMKELNRWMNSLNQRNQRIPYYFTAIYLVLNKKDKTIEYVNAGHPAGYALVDKNEMLSLSSNMCAVGFFEDIAIQKETIPYTESIQLLLFTDGVEEAVEQNNPNPSEYLQRFASFYWTAARTAEPIDMILTKQQQVSADDDMCVVLIQAD
ncbi:MULTISPECIES: fused response regulator/phosphatase [unclassified Cytobacillus]|uniref:fused response regulator/phosphatase n=1 Tax=unclassified Cytobacillus TaxID=2675268 RepID=UPI00135AF6B4|nr:fused response regulator/phosphatase [Cytobacillus sp. AMY 15.2]KAF0816804.1 Serine phosphatase RsbU, regulator of sigma subunit [Bacillus sp. ZZV12-4809]MCM3092920.1 fused response regulator/phosphatase [Cytobacillus sp. AMY 15.2]